MEDDKYSLELNVAVRVVHMACSLCQKVQKGLLSSTSFVQFKSKEDNSPVTIADWSVQAMVSWILSEIFGSQNISIVAEEDVQTLSKPESAGLLEMVVNTVNECLSEAPRFGLKSPAQALGPSQVLEAIGRCNAAGGPLEVVIGVLGCPNYPAKRNWLVKHEQQSHAVPELSVTNPGIWEEGCILYTRTGSGEAWMQPLVQGDKKLVWPNSARLVRVSSIQDPALATFCEPVEEANSNHSFTAGLAQAVGLRKKPLRVHSMVKYAAIARGDAEIFMKFARAGYKEKIWDHAAGVLLVQEAGGVVTDAGGRPLDFSKGMYLEGLDRGIVACSGVKLHEKIIGAVYASWDSSNL
ncbi:PAP-specific phosphatase HAL2-like isoform X2 [Coffea eugenioides]|uniref:PAP-specific phosphatase HAL2-like isoform X2 n=1 Tax=Coffea eugenioides TaxID=49369 RepID=UPI000F60A4B5|nr:PAP-specific phosphatase HAL2-like isoform X2 [Coffea eugenioides]